MPSTHVSLLYHLIFSTKNRIPWIAESWAARLHQYLGGILRGLGGVAEGIGGADDHVHILASLNATHCLAAVLRDVKSGCTKWVHDVIGITPFEWQVGYGAFTVGRSEIAWIQRYIREQREHHRKKTFQEEYLELLHRYGIEYDERYLW